MYISRVQDQADANRTIWWCAAILIALALAFPLVLTPLPPLVDYPNHLARMLVLMSPDDPVLSRIDSIDWHVVPNVAMDLTIPPLARFMPLDVAGRIFVALCLLLPLVGAAILHRALFRRRSYWPLCIALVAYNGLFMLGFLNYVAGIGLMLVAAGVWVRQADGPVAARLLVASAFALALFLCHLMAVAFFGVVIAAIEAEQLWRARRRLTPSVVAGRLACLAVPFIAPAALFLFAAPLAKSFAGAPDVGFLKAWWWALNGSSVNDKLWGFAWPFLTYDTRLDMLALVLLVLVVLRALVLRGLHVHAGLVLVAAASFLLYPSFPRFSRGPRTSMRDCRCWVHSYALRVSRRCCRATGWRACSGWQSCSSSPPGWR